jgi:hypothetical protein
MEVCPQCGSVYIEWDGVQYTYKCLNGSCGATWASFDGPPVPYSDIKNTCLRLSLSPGQPLPASHVGVE